MQHLIFSKRTNASHSTNSSNRNIISSHDVDLLSISINSPRINDFTQTYEMALTPSRHYSSPYDNRVSREEHGVSQHDVYTTDGSGNMDSGLILNSMPYRSSDPDQLSEPVLEYHSETYVIQSPRTRFWLRVVYIIATLVAMYYFLVAIKWIGDGFTLALACHADHAFSLADNPLSGLIIGTMTTGLIQSSSTVTSLTVALVGAGALTIENSVYIVMGANIGTCITCMMVSFGQVHAPVPFERSIATAAVHDIYNLWCVIVLMPIEIIFHPLEKISVAMSMYPTFTVDENKTEESFSSFLSNLIQPMASSLLKIDSDGITAVVTKAKACSSTSTFVVDGIFVDSNLSDETVGISVAVMGFILLIITLFCIVAGLQNILEDGMHNIVQRFLSYNGYTNILMGTLLTALLQSSSIITSTLTVMAGLTKITLEQAYPIILGANLGTTSTALLAAMVTGKRDALAIALVHFWFNVFGIFLFYPVRFTRSLIFTPATWISFVCGCWPLLAAMIIAFLFFILPGSMLVLLLACNSSNLVISGFGWATVGLLITGMSIVFYWLLQKGGYGKICIKLEKIREERTIRGRGEEDESRATMFTFFE